MRNKVFVVGARGIPDVEGGAEKNAEFLFPLMVARGWDVTLVGLSHNITSDSYRGIKLLRAPASRFLKTDKLAYYLAAIGMAFKRKPDVVHMQGLGSALFLWVYKAMGFKTVVRYGSADYLVSKWGILGRLGFLAAEYQLRFADAVIAVTPALADRLAQRGIASNVHVIANATDPSSDLPDGDTSFMPTQPYVLAVGRVTEQKNIHRLVEGFNQIADSHPDVVLAIAGGIDDESYMDLVRPHLTDRVKLLGRLPRSSLGPLYRGAIAYVNSSVHEGSSNAVLEAISWQAPILLSDIPENRDFGIPGHHYFSPDDPKAIATALRAVIGNPKGYMTNRSHFLTWSDVAERTSSIYERNGLSPEPISAALQCAS